MSPGQVDKTRGTIEQNMVPVRQMAIVNLQPGDVVVLTTRNGFRPSPEERIYIRESLASGLPAGVKVVVLNDLDMGVLRGVADGGETTEAYGAEAAGRECGEAGAE